MRPRRRISTAGLVVSLMTRVIIANFGGAVLTFVFYSFILPPVGNPISSAEYLEFLTLFGVYAVLTGVVGWVWGSAIIAPALDVTRTGTPISDRQVVRILRVPMKLTIVSATFWLVAIPLFSGFNVIAGQPGIEAARVAVGTFVAGFGACAVTYLLTEAGMRRIYAAVLSTGNPRSGRGSGLRARLILMWLCGCILPLASVVGVAAFGTTGKPLTVPILYSAAVGVTAGTIVMRYAGRSLWKPMRDIRRAMQNVADGDLSALVEINSAGEVGMLQAGFNRMMDGLRERARMEDLFGRHVGEEIMRRAMDRGLDLTGQQTTASVVFVDIIGSTKLASKSDPTAVVAELNRFFEVVIDVVEEMGGTINKFEGDGAMALFGTPDPLDDHAGAALKAARVMHERLVEAGAPDHGVGVSTGVVVEGNVGSDRRFEFTVIGDPVNEASRLCDVAKGEPRRVYASDQTVWAAAKSEGDRWVAAAHLNLRGREDPTYAFRPKPVEKQVAADETELDDETAGNTR